MKRLYCINCGEDVEYKVTHETNEYNYKDVITAIDETVKSCIQCGEELYDEEETERVLKLVYSKYLEKFGMSFEGFKEVREQFGLSQDIFAKVMNWSKKTIVRYENRQSMPQGESLNRYADLKKDPTKILYYLQINRKYLSDDEYNKILKTLEREKLYSTSKEKLKNTILYFLNMKKLYTTQLMKYLFATDFLHHKNYGVSITGSSYAKLPFGPVLDNYRDIINEMMHSGYIEISDIKMIGNQAEDAHETYFFKALSSVNKSLFSDDEIKTINNISTKFKGKSSKNLSEWSHKFIGWQKTNDSKIISYDYSKYLDL